MSVYRLAPAASAPNAVRWRLDVERHMPRFYDDRHTLGFYRWRWVAVLRLHWHCDRYPWGAGWVIPVYE